jgi:HD-GYP domain-containing protein (c-di-GMP phosphodiesterase class II)
LAARIVAVADVFDALRTDRPYKPAWTNEQARDYIARGAGTQFDPVVAGCLIERLQEFVGLQQELAETEPSERADASPPRLSLVAV